MDKTVHLLKWLGSILAGILGFFIGDANPLIFALISFMVIDYITGVIYAGVTHTLSSHIGFKGIWKKFVIILIVSIAHIIDVTIIKEGNTLQSMTAFFYIANEGISILENAVNLGLPVPGILKRILLQIKEKSDERSSAEQHEKTE